MLILTNPTDICTYLTNCTYEQHDNYIIYTLTDDITLTINSTVYIQLSNGDIFNGKNYKITINNQLFAYFSGLFTLFTPIKQAIIKNLNIYILSTGRASTSAIINSYQSNFKIINCHVDGEANMYFSNNNSGGFVGQYCSKFTIINSSFNINVTETTNNFMGGFVANNCSNFKIINSTSNGQLHISDGYSGFVSINCYDFYVYNCKNNYTILYGNNYSGFVGSYCYNFKIKDSFNYSDFNGSYTTYSGFIGVNCNNFKLIGLINYGNFMNCINSSGIVGYGCTNFKAIKCINKGNCTNESNKLAHFGGICGTNCGNYLLYKCENYGNIYGYQSNNEIDGSGGIVGPSNGSSGIINYNNGLIIYSTFIKIIKCTNYGLINAYYSGGICGSDLGSVNTDYITNINSIPNNNLHILIKDCKNKSIINNDLECAGICGSNLCSIYTANTYEYIMPVICKIINCYTKKGYLISANCEFTYSTDHYNTNEIYIYADTRTRTRTLIKSISKVNSGANPHGIYYIKHNKKINLFNVTN